MIVDAYMIVFLGGMLLGIFATITAKGYGIIWGIIATLCGAFTLPLVILLIAMFIIPPKKGSYWEQ
jgi:phage shock protein PspC (stress-responsive transcriptional regulator)